MGVVIPLLTTEALAMMTVVTVVMVTGKGEQGQCSYNFQVWTPDGDVVHKMENLTRSYQQFHNSLSRITKNGNDINHLGYQTLELKHTIKVVEAGNKDLVDTIKDHTVALRILDNMKIGTKTELRKIVRSTRMANRTLSVLKNALSNLKAEWIVLKREGVLMKQDNILFKYGQNSIDSKMAKLGSRMGLYEDSLQELLNDKSILKKDLKILADQMDDFKVDRSKNFTRMYEEMLEVRKELIASQLETIKTQQKMIDVYNLNTQINRDLVSMKGENNILKSQVRQILAVLNTTGNMSINLPDIASIPTIAPHVKDSNRDCHAVYKSGRMINAMYYVQPEVSHSVIPVYCDMVNGTGWTVIQRRLDGSLSFDRLWLEYVYGFGNVYTEFWLGLDKIHQLTKTRTYTLRIDMQDWDGRAYYAQYDSFSVGSKAENYRLHVLGYSGNSGDSLSIHSGMKFSSKDKDGDISNKSCAKQLKGGWWFLNCGMSNLNGVYQQEGRYRSGQFPTGITWFTLTQSLSYSLFKVEMKIKPLIASIS